MNKNIKELSTNIEDYWGIPWTQYSLYSIKEGRRCIENIKRFKTRKTFLLHLDISIDGRMLTHLHFVEDLNTMINNLASESEKVGLKFNIEKRNISGTINSTKIYHRDWNSKRDFSNDYKWYWGLKAFAEG